MVANTVYDRTNLVDATIETVKTNLFEGAVLVVVVLLVLLGNFRAALITAAIIPLSMLMTISGMVSGEISANLMSLGRSTLASLSTALSSLWRTASAASRRNSITASGDSRAASASDVVFDATREVIKPSIFGVIIIMVVYLPILSLQGIEGKMFHPMAYTVMIALAAAMVLSITFVPAAVALFLGGKISEKENFFMRFARRLTSRCSAAHSRHVASSLPGRLCSSCSVC